MKDKGFVELILDVVIVGGVLAFLYAWYHFAQKGKTQTTTTDNTLGLPKLNRLKMQTDGVLIDGVSWRTKVWYLYHSNIPNKTAAEVVQMSIDNIKDQPERYDEVKSKSTIYGSNSIAYLIVLLAIEEAVQKDWIDRNIIN